LELVRADDPDGQKKSGELTQTAGKKILSNGATKVDNTNDLSPDLSTYPKKISTPRKKGENRVNKRIVRQRIAAMINTKKGEKELYFWTVTFPQGINDDTAYRIYNIWLTSLRKYRMLKNYLWVAERQGNGTIHYHIAIPHKMNVQRANAMMAGTLKREAKNGTIPFSPFQAKRYNGVHIAKGKYTKQVTNFAIKKGSRALSTYLTKYVTKNDGTFTHLAWHNSRGYSNLFTAITLTFPEFNRLFPVPEAVLHTEFRAYETDYFFFAPWQHGPPQWFTEHLYQLNSFIQSQLN
jgi:hypothetical protein